jgi:hypothetical protein
LSIDKEDDLAHAGEIEPYGAGKGGERVLSLERNLRVIHEKPGGEIDVQRPAVNQGGEHGASPREDSERVVPRRPQEYSFCELGDVLFQDTMPREKALFRDHSSARLRREKEHAHDFPVPCQKEEEQGEEKDPQKCCSEDQGPAPQPRAEYEIQSIEHLHSRLVRIAL